MQRKDRTAEDPLRHRPLAFIIFLGLGVSIFAVPNCLLPAQKALYEVCLTLLLALVLLIVSRYENLAGLRPVLFAFFTAAAAYTSTYLIAHPYSLESSVESIAYQKMLDTAAVVVPIIAFTLASRNSLGSLMIRRGTLKLGFVVGLATFLVFLLTSVQVSTLLFYGQDLTPSRLAGWAPWVLLFILPNGLREELLFRGLFLNRYEPFFGKSASNFLQALVFSSAHLGSTYTPALAIFLVITFLLGLGFGELMRRTGSLLGSVLFHAGADIPIVLGYFSMVS